MLAAPIHRRLATRSGTGSGEGRGDGGIGGGRRVSLPSCTAIQRLQSRFLDGTSHARIGAESLSDDIRMADGLFICTVHSAGSLPPPAIFISTNVTFESFTKTPQPTFPAFPDRQRFFHINNVHKVLWDSPRPQHQPNVFPISRIFPLLQSLLPSVQQLAGVERIGISVEFQPRHQFAIRKSLADRRREFRSRQRRLEKLKWLSSQLFQCFVCTTSKLAPIRNEPSFLISDYAGM